MKLSEFDYYLPKELIAQYPLENRLEARLLVLNRKDGSISHCLFKDITDHLHKDDLLVLNDTRVLACRLRGFRKTGGKVEILLLARKSGSTFSALIKPARIKHGEQILFDHGSLKCSIDSRQEVTFDCADINTIYALGDIPLPPYIKREPQQIDNIYYQTVYAREDGAIASPTAGIHFTLELLEALAAGGIGIAYVTLHVGYGTFKPVKIEDISGHKMDPEFFRVNDRVVSAVMRAKEKKGRIIAVGTTSLRALESSTGEKKEGYTDLFIYPGYKFKVTDCLLTNFHLPKTTLFMLACAFAGHGLIYEAYRKAVESKYRFYSYGDAMLII